MAVALVNALSFVFYHYWFGDKLRVDVNILSIFLCLSLLSQFIHRALISAMKYLQLT